MGAYEDLLTVQQAADYLRVSRHTLYLWKGKGYGPPFIDLTPKNRRYRKSDIDAWLDANASQRLEA